MRELLITAGAAVLGYALRQFAHPLPRRLGALCYLGATFLAGWFLTGRTAGGLAAVGAWFLLPWVEIVLRVRKMRLPLQRSLRHRFPPNREEFPQLQELTAELEGEGFETTDDTGVEWDEIRQFFRVCYHAPSLTQAVIHLNQQPGYSVVFVSVTSRTSDGRVIVSTNYPFAQTMLPPPNLLTYRVPEADSFSALLVEHRAALASLGVAESDLASPGEDGLSALMQTDLDEQVRHNLGRGLIVESGNGTYRYSWRGCFYLWGQYLKDMIRLA